MRGDISVLFTGSRELKEIYEDEVNSKRKARHAVRRRRLSSKAFQEQNANPKNTRADPMAG